jgi:hypothetical protein
VHLAERHDVHVVVDEDRAAEMLRQHGPHRVLVPTRHDRRGHRHTVPERHRPGDTDAGAVQLERAVLRAQLADELEDHRQNGLGAVADVDGLADLLHHAQVGVGERDVHRRGADVDSQEAQAAGQVDDRGPAPTSGRGEPTGLDQAHLGQAVQLDGQLRARQVHGVTQLGPAHRAEVAQQT